MIRILHSADWHIGDFPGPSENGRNMRKYDTLKCIEKLVEVSASEKPDIVMISGDIFHQARVWGNRALDEVGEAISYIYEISQYATQVIVMRGTPNHDGEEQFEMLRQYFDNIPNVEVVTEPTVVHALEMDVACVPGFDKGEFRAQFPGLSKEEEDKVFTEELGNIVIGLKKLCRPTVPSALMTHYTVPGCNSESGQSTFLQQFEPVVTTEALATADYDIVCLGHIHRPQQLPNVKNCFYSGAINAMNFNDEGQARGFWIHEFENSDSINSTLVPTPHREFYTIRLDDTNISQINSGGIDLVGMMKWSGSIDKKIVRVLYECSLDNNKALNKAVLEKKLMEDGAFYVWEITPAKLSVVADKTNLGRKTDPEENLVKYLEEKGYEKEQIKQLVSKARTIIAEAVATDSASAMTGVFVPVSIEVKNYRNYVDEKFDFSDISFCTINGQNGAGKSSLFMDAIVDCLYEEPREGDLTGWIRADEKARSGSIVFTFKIGEKLFRVTRTRARSGKGTLNISEFENGEWIDRSAEKYRDTQVVIEQLLGMDSLTFKSCALIMQDQYGLFLQAQKEDRMTILSSLLGLNIYQLMERNARDTAKQFGAKMRDTKNAIGIHENTIAAYGDPEHDLEILEDELKKYSDEASIISESINAKTAELINLEDSKKRADKADEELRSLIAKRIVTVKALEEIKTTMSECDSILSMKETIESKTKEYESLQKKLDDLSEKKILFDSKKETFTKLEASTKECQGNVDSLLWKRATVSDEIERINAIDIDSIKAGVERHEDIGRKLDELNEKAMAFLQANMLADNKLHEFQSLVSSNKSKIEAMRTRISICEKKAALLEESVCVDIENANCKFLQDAKAAKAELDTLRSELSSFEEKAIVEETEMESEVLKLREEAKKHEYDENNMKLLKASYEATAVFVEKYDQMKERETLKASLMASLESIESNILSEQKRLAMVKSEALSARNEYELYSGAAAEYVSTKLEQDALRKWIDIGSKIPVMEERAENAKQRKAYLDEQMIELHVAIEKKEAEMQEEESKSIGIEEKQAEIESAKKVLRVVDGKIKDIQLAIGGDKEKISTISGIKDQIKALQKDAKAYAIETADYDILKAAFSQDGIPHQIIRTIVPQITDTANNILGQMTGGKMGVEFKTEKVLKSNSKKEVVTLDILITEYGKGTLPYLSKSGGEKVKASLSVILSLAEMKSSAAGIQLGMLFIDEPPFLDSDGIQAYCDALETIQSRYPELKIMAITHDPTMKARFPQSLDVIKTNDGSKVIY